MVRLQAFALLGLASAGAACTGDIEASNLMGLPVEEQVARTRWVEEALPLFALEKYKCMGCHDGSMPMAPAYLAGEDDLAKRETVVLFMPRVINLLAPKSSRMLSVGDHKAVGGGPALDAPDATRILNWVNVERFARPVPEPIRTAQVPTMVCATQPCPVNTVDLSTVGPTPVPATIEFSVSLVGSDAYFTNAKIKAGAMGLYVEHPLFETYPAGAAEPEPDPQDRFYSISVNLAPNTERELGTNGTFTIIGFNPADPMSFQFDVIEKQRMMP